MQAIPFPISRRTRLLAASALLALVAACGGGSDDDDNTSSSGNTSGNSSNTGGGSGNGSSTDNGSPAGTLITHTYYSRDHAGARQVEIDPEADSATITLGSDIITYTYNEATDTTTATGGYSLIGGVDDDEPGIQICQGGVSIHIVLPTNAQPATLDELKGKTLTWYEDCAVSDGTGQDPLPSSATFASDGALSLRVGSGTESLDAAGVAAVLSAAGWTDAESGDKMYGHAYLVSGQPVVVFRGVDGDDGNSWIAGLATPASN